MRVVGCIDVGLKRIGLASCFDGKTVLPSKPVIRKNRVQAAREVSEFLSQKRVEVLIVGVPLGGESENEMQRRIEHFVSLIDFEGEIFFQDEYGSSAEASELAKGVFRQKKDGKIDSLSAAVILDRWLHTKEASSILRR